MSNPLPSGTLLRDGRYRIKALYRMGGQSIVYEGKDIESGQQVIIKQTYEDQEWSHEAIQQEACLMDGLKHRSLPQVLDCFVERGSTFLVMNRIPGADVGELLKKRGVPFLYSEVLGWTNQLLDILEYLQSQETVIIHRDINPKNIRLTPDNQIFLLDFGIAKRIDRRTLLIGGTPHYAPPEQLKDEGTDRRSDIYALAATLYYLLTAIEPPDSLSRESAILKGLPDPLRPACELNKEIPQLTSQVLSRSLSLDRERRPSDAIVMRRWLHEASEGVYSEEIVTIVSPANEIDTEKTQLSIREPSRVIVPFDLAVRGDATQEARELIYSLDNGHDLNPSLIQVLIEMMDRQPESREGSLTRHSDLLHKHQHGKSYPVVSLIYCLASDPFIDPEVSKQLRQKLGRFLADHTLSEMSSDTTHNDTPAELLPNADSIHQHINHGKWLRELAVWFVRGMIASISGQLLLSLITRGQTLIGLLSADRRPLVWAVHLFLLGFIVLFLLFVRKMSTVRWRSKEKYSSACHITGFSLGALLAIVFFYDILWIIGLT